MHDILPPVQQSIQQQQSLGWDQLYQGCIVTAWAKTITQVHPTMKCAGNQVMISLQCAIWQHILNTWALHNQHLHHTANTMNIPDYQQALQTLYDQCDQLNPEAQEAL